MTLPAWNPEGFWRSRGRRYQESIARRLARGEVVTPDPMRLVGRRRAKLMRHELRQRREATA